MLPLLLNTKRKKDKPTKYITFGLKGIRIAVIRVMEIYPHWVDVVLSESVIG